MVVPQFSMHQHQTVWIHVSFDIFVERERERERAINGPEFRVVHLLQRTVQLHSSEIILNILN